MLIFNSFSYGQNNFYFAGGASGELILGQTNDCSYTLLGNFYGFLDVAITPNGTLYGIADSLYLIDTTTGQYYSIGLVEKNGTYAAGVGLVALNNNYLLGDDQDTLVKISTITGQAESLGYIGHFCNGDFAFFNGKLYMISNSGHLIEIILDASDHHVSSVTDIGLINTPFQGAIFSLFTTYESCSNTKALFGIEGDKLYKINITDANASYICTLSNNNYSNGAASIYDFDLENFNYVFEVPNVFTPNNDGINDCFKLKNVTHIPNGFDVYIYNRWGSKIFGSDNPGFNWDGTSSDGDRASDGVYFYLISYHDNCGEIYIRSGYVTLIR